MFFSKKRLNHAEGVACSASLLLTSSPPNGEQASKGGRVLLKRAESFLIKNRKHIDDASKKIFADSLSLIGKLFEIYFVRLIGTPNQNSKNGSSFGWSRV